MNHTEKQVQGFPEINQLFDINFCLSYSSHFLLGVMKVKIFKDSPITLLRIVNEACDALNFQSTMLQRCCIRYT